MQRRGDQDAAVHAAKSRRIQGVPKTGSSGAKKEGVAQAKRPQEAEEGDTTPPGLEHPGRNKQQGPPPPGLDHLRTSGGQMPRTGSSGPGQAAGTAAPPDWSIHGPAAVDAPRTGTSGAEQAAGAMGSHKSGHEDEAVEMQRSGMEDEAGEEPRKQDEDKAKVTQ